MSHFIGPFTVDSSEKNVRFAIEGEPLLLSRQEAQKLADALKTDHHAELFCARESGGHFILRLKKKTVGDRQLSVELVLPVLGVQAQQLARALIEEASKIHLPQP